MDGKGGCDGFRSSHQDSDIVLAVYSQGGVVRFADSLPWVTIERTFGAEFPRIS
jgi:hypothetical protein